MLDLFSKRITGYINWKQNRAVHMAGGTVGQLVAAMAKQMPDHIAVTGDLTNLALDSEIVNAAAWLGELGNPADVSVVPGNHDAYVRGALSKAVTAWKENMTSEAAGITVTRSGFPYLRQRGPAAIIGVNSAIATAPFMASGIFTRRQARGLGQLLERARNAGLFRVILIHHPPVAGACAWTRRLVGADLVRHAIHRFGAELILHGHNHRTSVATLPGPNGDVPVVGAAAPGARPHGHKPGGSYNLLKVVGEPGNYVIGMFERGWRDGAVETIQKRLLTADQPTATHA